MRRQQTNIEPQDFAIPSTHTGLSSRSIAGFFNLRRSFLYVFNTLRKPMKTNNNSIPSVPSASNVYPDDCAILTIQRKRFARKIDSSTYCGAIEETEMLTPRINGLSGWLLNQKSALVQ
jgi:hypothetical protein